MNQDCRGMRFAFDASAEIAAETAPKTIFPSRVTELSLWGCFLETSVSFEAQRMVLLKISDSGESFEAQASVLYVRPSGIGLMFHEIQPHFRAVLQKWILRALDNQLDALETSA
jgi:PilZ domain